MSGAGRGTAPVFRCRAPTACTPDGHTARTWRWKAGRPRHGQRETVNSPPGAGCSRRAAWAMLRAVPPNTKVWNGAMLHQYACPSSPCGWNSALAGVSRRPGHRAVQPRAVRGGLWFRGVVGARAVRAVAAGRHGGLRPQGRTNVAYRPAWDVRRPVRRAVGVTGPAGTGGALGAAARRARGARGSGPAGTGGGARGSGPAGTDLARNVARSAEPGVIFRSLRSPTMAGTPRSAWCSTYSLGPMYPDRLETDRS